ncbi:MAG: NADH-quinone oxidoreductase subunit C [Pontiellaceae bacterium]|nr:NADH-quinone oxidoreductase subunit C [Pontiellaceae bacterium]
MSPSVDVLNVQAGVPVALDRVPRHDMEAFRRIVLREVGAGSRVASFFGAATAKPGELDLFMLLANDAGNRMVFFSTRIEGDHYPSLTPDCPQLHLFEREIAEQFGVHPDGHPWLKPVRYPAASDVPGSGEFYRVEGDEIHEVAVGPVHAGIIEPGHFRFQCHGEQVFHLEIALGYQHRGVEKAFVEQPAKRHLHYAETLCGDTTIGHATAYCQLVEALSGCHKTVRSQALRGIALEFERLANHIGDIGAISSDVGFLPTAAYCGRIRGDFLNMTAVLCGSRFGHGMLRPGGAGYDLDEADVDDLLKRLALGEKDAASAIELFFDTPSVLARLDGIGVLSAEVCRELGIVGPAARAAGLERDARHNHPSGIYRFAQLPLSTWSSGDVFGRAFVRWLEIRHSITFIREQLRSLPSGEEHAATGPLKPDHLAVSLIEGWRGELCHVAITDGQGGFRRYKVTDPSFHNWAGLAHALRNQEISDFPLCNKSFNLSYCGHDL